MSFILDALRKSENARQRHGGPGLAEVPLLRRRENRPWWIAGIAVLLLVNLGVLLVVLTRDEPVAAPESPVTPVAPASAPPAATPTAPAMPATPPASTTMPAQQAAPGATRSLAEEAAGAIDLNRDPDAPAGSATAAANVPERAPIVQPLAPPAAAATPAPGAEENLPTINELTGDRAANMPAMHIDIHVHSGRPQERFVFINMKKYVEGDTLSEGPVLERITPEGVILNQRGFRFILPRQ